MPLTSSAATKSAQPEERWLGGRKLWLNSLKREIWWKTLSECPSGGSRELVTRRCLSTGGNINWLGQTENQPAAFFQPNDRRRGLTV